MAKVITTTEISFHIEQIIKNAKEYVFIVTPFIKMHKRLRDLLKEKMKNKTLYLFIVCRQKDLAPGELKWAEGNQNVHVYFHENLHAKCYFNEEKAVITSMNLYEFSMVNNIEFGTLIERNSDQENFKSLLQECDVLTENKRESHKQVEIIRISLADAIKKASLAGAVMA